MPAAIGGALNASQIDGDAMRGRGRPEFVEVSGLRLNSLSRVLGENRLLQGGVETCSVGTFEPEWIARNQRLTEGHQLTALLCRLLHVRLHFRKRGGAIQPDRCDLRETHREKGAALCFEFGCHWSILSLAGRPYSPEGHLERVEACSSTKAGVTARK